ncbi:class I SAM-dependent methyltransferase [Mesorhizobium sp. RMAD-H1]|uniref:class I SAM-dependent methyltransferase n=1 Tax=Mesorhizobium sp. RMAD-H1 TaxID=2587065 RepID=UPI00160A65E8|nr:class I SAM-dependent methyltransferase [Mesorhizobium sp. RMAD-H1]MBB2970320.1 SAM-dependent methyltransferase [Mesorhizobium sp. RMAD-H1]
MAEERMHLEAQYYDAFYAAQHVGRYQILKDYCRGKTVLDIACGEGYGSALLAEWGASNITGIDVSSEAISEAKRLFERENIQFHQGDAHTVDAFLKGKKFDVIACFETIEHLADATKFLKAIKSLAKRDGLIVISCPNEKNDFSNPEENPFHVAAYTLGEFRRLTEDILGPAKNWILGTPQQGIVNFDINDAVASNRDAKLIEIVTPSDISSTSLIAPMPAVAADPSSCLYFVGVWGKSVGASAVVSPWCYPAFVSPWQKIEHLERTLDEKDVVIDTLNKRLAVERKELGAYRSRLVKLSNEKETLTKRLAVEGKELSAYRSRLIELSKEMDATRASFLAELEMYRRSKSLRMIRRLSRAYDIPVVGRVLRLARRIVARVVR